uniref:nuclear transport factor 2 family protein n=1 Tax=uncultured Rhizobium sp. TaxID=155567 RepID=UPI002637ABA6|nr:nuclear transport factor 2 family protein [uncultured Rhizobium sp.]
MRAPFLTTVFVCLTIVLPAIAQEPVVPAKDPEHLFTSPDPRLHANKQVVYHIIRDLLEAGHWEMADQFLSEDYIQHNPNAASGRESVVTYFTKVLKVEPKEIPAKMRMKITSVTAEGDLVVVTYPRLVKDAALPKGGYTTTWFDMWKIVDGKAVEHWDPALLNEAPDLQ